MDLKLLRTEFDDKCTIGELYLGSDPTVFCFTLEPANKDGSEGYCIPQGRYQIMLMPSPKFERDMPELQNVPGRTEILIHWGNFPHDTQGCILVAFGHEPGPAIQDSRAAFDDLFGKLAADVENEIEIVGGARPPEPDYAGPLEEA